MDQLGCIEPKENSDHFDPDAFRQIVASKDRSQSFSVSATLAGLESKRLDPPANNMKTPKQIELKIANNNAAPASKIALNSNDMIRAAALKPLQA